MNSGHVLKIIKTGQRKRVFKQSRRPGRQQEPARRQVSCRGATHRSYVRPEPADENKLWAAAAVIAAAIRALMKEARSLDRSDGLIPVSD